MEFSCAIGCNQDLLCLDDTIGCREKAAPLKGKPLLQLNKGDKLTPAFISVFACCLWFMFLIHVAVETARSRPDRTEGAGPETSGLKGKSGSISVCFVDQLLLLTLIKKI